MKMKRWAFAIATLVVIAIGGLFLGYPPAAAALCPACFGLSSAGSGIFIEKTDDPAATRAAQMTIGIARQRVRNFYGDLQSHPRILVCVTEACYQKIGGGQSTGMALLNFALLLSPRGDRVVIAAHEISHIELHARLGLFGTLARWVPQWFDEGLAAVISDDPRYVAPTPDRCILHSDEDLSTARAAWVVSARSHQLYAKAACRVMRWMAANGGPRAVPDLIRNVSDGGDFDSLVR
jgi:hypothetical protein